ncbi:DUF29 domain-containing protein [Allochromatium palmeri]|nr:DUF29 domain-containing protein [Allochromatium palmeri]
MHTYNEDILAWSMEQAQLIRAGRFDLVDIEHVAEEIEDVGKSEQRELTSRMSVLLAHLLKWQYQPERRGASWERTIRAQRKEIAYHLDDTPSLKPKLLEPRWLDMVWSKALAQATTETGLDCFPETCPWLMDDEILNACWFPET